MNEASRDSSPLKIALFTGAYNHIADGVSLTLNRLVAYLEARGMKVLVLAPSVDDPELDHAGTLLPARSLAAPGRPEYRISLGLSPRLRGELAQFAPDLVHIATPDILGFTALRWAKGRHLPVVATYHTHFSSYLSYYHMNLLEPVMWRYLRWFYQQCEAVYVPSESMIDVLKAQGIDARFELWARGVETDTFHPDKRSTTWRQSHGFGDDEPVITFVSRLVWEKNLEMFAAVVEALGDTPHRSLIVGDGPAREALEKRLPRTVFTGRLEGEALATAYASSDIFFFPSASETFGNVTLEAMASALPTVCADATGSRSLVQHGLTGYLAPPEDAATFESHIRTLLDSSERRSSMGSAARERALDYSWPRILEQMASNYRAVLADKKPEAVGK